jgi:hypothetical protein
MEMFERRAAGDGLNPRQVGQTCCQAALGSMRDPGIRVGYLFGKNEQITGTAETRFTVENAMLAARDTIHVLTPQEL